MFEKLGLVVKITIFAVVVLCFSILYNKSLDASSVVSGTAFFINSEGYIATAAHVVRKKNNFFILYKKRFYPARLVLVDRENDIAILKTNIIPMMYLPLTTTLSNGTFAGIYGYPEGTHKLTLTIGRYTYGGLFTKVVYTHFKACQGNSGGPIINMFGQVIGMLQKITYPLYGVCSYESFGVSAKYIIQNAKYQGIRVDTYDYRIAHSFKYWYNAYKDSIVYIEASK